MTEKQSALIGYLVQKLGFLRDDFQTAYRESLRSKAHQFRHLRMVDEKEKEELERTERFKTERVTYDVRVYYPTKYTELEYILDEFELKKEKRFLCKLRSTEYISATDLSAFHYCPVSYAIHSSIEVAESEAAFLGNVLHEEAR